MRSLLALIAILIPIYPIHCQEHDIQATDLPEALTENAVAILRYSDSKVEVSENKTFTMDTEYAITILDENGIEEGYFAEVYNSLQKCSGVRATIYDKEGNKVRKVKQEEIFDISNIAGYSLYEDSRVILANPSYNQYPYTIVYSYKVSSKDYFSYPPWVPHPNYNVSVQNSSYTISAPESVKIRYFAANSELEPYIIKAEGDRVSYHWSVASLPALENEYQSPNPRNLFPILFTSPEEVDYDGIQGNLSNWDSFGKWVWEMVKDKQELPPEAREEVLRVIADCSSDREKVETLYAHMQDKVRYVNIAVGIGGLDPIPAERVHEVCYGDCKALTNYMSAMLKVAGISSDYTIVAAGEDAPRINVEFPFQQFNHVILMVPLEKDSIWLECTSQRLPAGYL